MTVMWFNVPFASEEELLLLVFKSDDAGSMFAFAKGGERVGSGVGFVRGSSSVTSGAFLCDSGRAACSSNVKDSTLLPE